jgi:hypothetical protein
MAFIYTQSYLIFGAASVKDSDESFLFIPRSPYIKCPFCENIQLPPNGKLLFSILFFDFAKDFESGTYESPLTKRGWVKQERLFSQYTVYFTTRKIYWEYRRLFWAETGKISNPLSCNGSKMAVIYL